MLCVCANASAFSVLSECCCCCFFPCTMTQMKWKWIERREEKKTHITTICYKMLFSLISKLIVKATECLRKKNLSLYDDVLVLLAAFFFSFRCCQHQAYQKKNRLTKEPKKQIYHREEAQKFLYEKKKQHTETKWGTINCTHEQNEIVNRTEWKKKKWKRKKTS